MNIKQTMVSKDNKNFKLVLEIVLILAFSITVYISARTYDILEQIVEFSWKHENWEIDELFTVTFFLSFVLLFLLIRRWKNLKNALSEIRQLRGIIPICSSCKKIRDDKGYWHQVEKYISENSEVLFSHSICPECVKKIYPELAGELK